MTATERYDAGHAYYATLARKRWRCDDEWIDLLTIRCTVLCGGDKQSGERLARDVIWGNRPAEFTQTMEHSHAVQ